jgi:hypothetical protein
MILPSLSVLRYAFARSGRNIRSLGSVRLHVAVMVEPLQLQHHHKYQPRCCSFSSSSTTCADPYDRYRKQIPSNSVLRELLEETKTTLKSIDSVLYQKVRGEIQKAVEEGVSSDVRVVHYRYHFITLSEEINDVSTSIGGCAHLGRIGC